MDWTDGVIAGVRHGRLTTIADPRGSFTELWRDGWTAGLTASFRQANLSRSARDVLRGLHFHDRQDDLWIVLDGRAHVALVDLRPLIAGTGVTPVVEQAVLESGSVLLIPSGVAHGFLALAPLTLQYLVTNEYDGSDEHGFAWDDPSAGIDWPVGTPILSGRDAANPSLPAAVEAARQRRSAAS